MQHGRGLGAVSQGHFTDDVSAAIDQEGCRGGLDSVILEESRRIAFRKLDSCCEWDRKRNIPASPTFVKLRALAARQKFGARGPALDALWISYWEPFHGAIKKDFGFQVTLKVVEDTSPASH